MLIRLVKCLQSIRLLVSSQYGEDVGNLDREFRQNTQKLKELILYISFKWADAKFFGDTKLNKVLFAIDFDSFLKLGSPVTGSTYIRDSYGPRSYPLLPCLKELESVDKDLYLKPEFRGLRIQRRPIPLRVANTSIFSSEELGIIEKWIDLMRDKTAKQVSDWSHEFEFWKQLDNGQQIPYGTIFWGPSATSTVTEEDIQWAKSPCKPD